MNGELSSGGGDAEMPLPETSRNDEHKAPEGKQYCDGQAGPVEHETSGEHVQHHDVQNRRCKRRVPTEADAQ